MLLLDEGAGIGWENEVCGLSAFSSLSSLSEDSPEAILIVSKEPDRFGILLLGEGLVKFAALFGSV